MFILSLNIIKFVFNTRSVKSYNNVIKKIYLLFQGLLKLDHCFVKPKNEDAEVIEVQAGDKKMKIVMAPGTI